MVLGDLTQCQRKKLLYQDPLSRSEVNVFKFDSDSEQESCERKPQKKKRKGKTKHKGILIVYYNCHYKLSFYTNQESWRHLHNYLPAHFSKDNDEKPEGSKIDVRLRTPSISSPCTQLGMYIWNSMMWVRL